MMAAAISWVGTWAVAVSYTHLWFKRDTVEELREYGFDLRLAFEDDPNNFAMFHAEGIPCVYIHSGYYE